MYSSRACHLTPCTRDEIPLCGMQPSAHGLSATLYIQTKMAADSCHYSPPLHVVYGSVLMTSDPHLAFFSGKGLHFKNATIFLTPISFSLTLK